MNVYVLIYDHEHGTDVSVHATEELAIQARADLVRRWCDDVAGAATRKKIRTALRDGRLWEAFLLYEDARPDERMAIESSFVSGAEVWDGFHVVEIDSGLVHRVRMWPSGHVPGETWCGLVYHWTGYAPAAGAILKTWIPPKAQVATCLMCLST